MGNFHEWGQECGSLPKLRAGQLRGIWDGEATSRARRFIVNHNVCGFTMLLAFLQLHKCSHKHQLWYSEAN